MSLSVDMFIYIVCMYGNGWKFKTFNPISIPNFLMLKMFHICDQPWDFQAYWGTWRKMNLCIFLEVILLQNTLQSCFAWFYNIRELWSFLKFKKNDFLLSKLIKYSLIHRLRIITILHKFLHFKHFSCNL